MNRSGGSDDDRTQLVPRQDNGDRDQTIIPGRQANAGGFSMPTPERPLRGQVIGTDHAPQPGPRARPGGAVPPMPQTPPPPPAQGETVFLIQQPGTQPDAKPFDPVVGWLIVTKGPGRGEFRPVFYGQNSIGRDPKQRISFDFGDKSDQKISRETHAYIVYDDVQRKFFIRDNGKSNLVRHNTNLVMMPTEIMDRDEISIGDTTLMFVALCNSSFDWLAADEPSKT